jgi:hypothetical protein
LSSEQNREALSDERQDKLRKMLRDAAKIKTSYLMPKETAEGSPIGSTYLFHAQLSADAAHPSLEALARHVSKDDDYILDAAPLVDDNEIGETLNFACLAGLTVCVGANDLLGGTTAAAADNALQRATDEYLRLTRGS